MPEPSLRWASLALQGPRWGEPISLYVNVIGSPWQPQPPDFSFPGIPGASGPPSRFGGIKGKRTALSPGPSLALASELTVEDARTAGTLADVALLPGSLQLLH